MAPPLASHALDLGLFIQKNGPKPWVEGAVPRQPAVGDPAEEFAGFCRRQRPDKSRWLSRVLRWLWQEGRSKDGSKQRRASRGTAESWRATGMQGRAAKGCPELEEKAPGLPTELGTCQKATQGREAQREEEATSVKAVNILNEVPHLKEDGWDEPIVRHKGRDGDVPRGRGGHGGETGQTKPLVQAGASGDEEGRTTGSPRSLGLCVEDKAAATIPRGNGDGQDFPPSAEGRCGDEPKRQVWEKLRRLGEDMARWEGRSTRDLAVRLTEVILRTETKTYPTETGTESHLLEQGQGGTRARVGSSEKVGALMDTRADIAMVQQCQALQDLAVYQDVSISGTVCGDYQHLLAMLEPYGNEQMWEDPGDDLLEQGDPPPLPRPAVAVECLMVLQAGSKEQWKKEFPNVWARYELDCGLLSEEKEVEVNGAPVPFQWQRPFPAALEKAVASVLQGLLTEGVVVKGNSSSNSPLQPVKKPNKKTLRLTLNCKAINKVTPVVVPLVDLRMAQLIVTPNPKSRYFSVVDLSNASFAVPLAVSSRERFAFTFRGQQYLFTRLPQGFHSTTSIVHQKVKEMLFQLAQEDKPWVVSYVDDILITGTTQKETEARTREVLKLIQKTGFKAKFEKAQLVQPQVDYLGVTMGAKGRKIQAKKLEAISEAPSPRDSRSLRSLLDRFYSLKDHIPAYWKLAQPLHRLTTGRVEWEWGPEQEQALNRLKRAVLTAPTLRFPDKSQPFVVRLTTSQRVVGATLLQEDKRGRLVPVGHSSHLLKDHQVSYQLQEKTCLAAVWATQAFKTLTESAPILIQMPHSPWKYLLRGDVLGSSGANPHPARWSLLLVKEGLKVRGPQPEWGQPLSTPVPTAPSLRQLPSDIPKANVWFMATQKGCSIGFAAVNLEERWLLGVAEEGSVPGAELVALGELLRRHQCSSPLYLYTSCWSLVARLQGQMDEWEREPEPWAISGDALWPSILRWLRDAPEMLHVRYVGGHRSTDLKEKCWSQKVDRRAREMSCRAVGSQQIWEPSRHEKQEIIARCHGWMHEGVEETLARVRQVAPWEGDSEEVARWVQSCLKCAEGREGAGGTRPQREEGPWSRVQLGYVNGLPKSREGHRSLLVVEDEFSGWVEAFPLRKGTVENVAKVLYEEVLVRYGTPRNVSLPSVPYLLVNAMGLLKASGVDISWTILLPYQVKPATATVRRLAWGAGKEWVEMLPVILAGLRAAQAQAAALSPYQIISGFPLEMRWGWEGDTCPKGNVLPWLRQLQEDKDGYRHRTEAALLGGCPEGGPGCPP